MKVMGADNYCISCGTIIPEGRQVCAYCEGIVNSIKPAFSSDVRLPYNQGNSTQTLDDTYLYGYIRRNEAINAIKNLNSSIPKDNYARGYDAALGRALIAVREVSPAADVQPVKHGKWIDCTFYDPCEKSWERDFEFKCSNCGHKIYNKPNDDNLFCGHCGARMDLKDGDAK